MTDMTRAPDRPVPDQPVTERNVPALAALRLSYRVVLRQLTSVARIIALTLLALVATVAAFALGRADADLEAAVRLISALGFAVVIPVVSLVFGGAAIGDLRDDKTLVYLWLRPMDRWPIVVGAFLAAVTLTAPITLIPVVLAAMLTGAGGGIVPGTIIAGVVAVAAYCAVFTLLGVWLRKVIVWGLAYILIWEGFIALGGAGVARFAIRKYTRSILVDRTGVDLDLADFSTPVGIIVPLAVAVVALALASWRLGNQDID
ncbi:MAG: ABC-2 type transport system permease protein [Gammaproteobacteria bacterium]|jgi:ABC-2 type transport system permease protein